MLQRGRRLTLYEELPAIRESCLYEDVSATTESAGSEISLGNNLDLLDDSNKDDVDDPEVGGIIDVDNVAIDVNAKKSVPDLPDPNNKEVIIDKKENGANYVNNDDTDDAKVGDHPDNSENVSNDNRL